MYRVQVELETQDEADNVAGTITNFLTNYWMGVREVPEVLVIPLDEPVEA